MIAEMLGDAVSNEVIVDALRRYDGNVSLAVNSILDSPQPAPTESAAPSAPKPTRAIDTLTQEQVIMEQRANGSWDASVLQKFGVASDAAAAMAAAPAPVPDAKANVWATLIVLALLEAKFAEFADEWKLIKAKSLRWVARESSAIPAFNLQEWTAAAKNFVSSVINSN